MSKHSHATPSAARDPVRRVVRALPVAALLWAAPVSTQPPIPPVVTKAMEDGRRVIDDAIAALGGPAFLALQTKIEKGRFFSFYNQQLSGLAKATVYTKFLIAPTTPDPKELYLRERQAFGDDEKWSVLFNEQDGYEITYRGIRPLPTETVEQFRRNRRSDIFYILLRRLNEKGLIFESRGGEVVDNYPMWKVDITDAENEVVTAYFHQSSKLPARIAYEWRSKDRIPHQEIVIYDKFRDAGGGVKLPLVLQRLRDGQRTFSMFAESIRINEPLSEDVLGLPADAKMLERLK